ncbi:hypothetical protein ACHAW6_009101 [Cyclotella cf. meneghiniana]
MIVRTRPSIILFGDSITQSGFSGGGGSNTPSAGWVSLLSNAYARRADVLNRGFSGYNTRHALEVLSSVFVSSDINVQSNDNSNDRVLMVAVFFGANDASLPGDREHCQHVPIDEYENNLRRIVQTIRATFPEENKGQNLRVPPILLITPPPIDEKKWDTYCIQNFNQLSPRTNHASKAYGDRVKCLAKDLECLVVDAFALLGGDHPEQEAYYGQNLEDGLHLNDLGNKLLYDGLIDVICHELPDFAPMQDGDGKYGSRGIPLDGALWKELC